MLSELVVLVMFGGLTAWYVWRSLARTAKTRDDIEYWERQGNHRVSDHFEITVHMEGEAPRKYVARTIEDIPERDREWVRIKMRLEREKYDAFFTKFLADRKTAPDPKTTN